MHSIAELQVWQSAGTTAQCPQAAATAAVTTHPPGQGLSRTATQHRQFEVTARMQGLASASELLSLRREGPALPAAAAECCAAACVLAPARLLLTADASSPAASVSSPACGLPRPLLAAGVVPPLPLGPSLPSVLRALRLLPGRPAGAGMHLSPLPAAAAAGGSSSSAPTLAAATAGSMPASASAASAASTSSSGSWNLRLRSGREMVAQVEQEQEQPPLPITRTQSAQHSTAQHSTAQHQHRVARQAGHLVLCTAVCSAILTYCRVAWGTGLASSAGLGCAAGWGPNSSEVGWVKPPTAATMT